MVMLARPARRQSTYASTAMQTRSQPAEVVHPALRSARSLARTLDTAIVIPGTNFRIGLDPILGLVPGIGDLAGVLLSMSILFSAARLGVSKATLLRMGVNIGIEAVIGTIPLLGDMFDAAWRANTRNVLLMEDYLADPVRARRAGTRWLVAVAAGVGIVLLAVVAGAVWLLVKLLRLLGLG